MSYDDLDDPPKRVRLSDLREGCLPDLFTLPKEPETSYAVPKRLHFVWLDEAVPAEYLANVDSFKRLNPEWETVIWNSSARPSWRNGDIFAHEQNPGGRSDIFRYEIVHEYGGVYCDIDTVCQRPLDEDVFGHSFVSSHVALPWRNVTNALFGFPAGSRFLDFVIRCLPYNYRARLREPGPNRTGPTFFTTCLLSYDDPSIRIIEQSLLNLHEVSSFMHHQLHANWVTKTR